MIFTGYYIIRHTSIYQSFPYPTNSTTNSYYYVSLPFIIDHFLALKFQSYYIISIDNFSKMKGMATYLHVYVLNQKVNATILVNTLNLTLYVIFVRWLWGCYVVSE